MIDQAIEAGDLLVSDAGRLALAQPEELDTQLQDQRDARKLQQLNPEDDTSEQEQVVLGYALAGDSDNASNWARWAGVR